MPNDSDSERRSITGINYDWRRLEGQTQFSEEKLRELAFSDPITGLKNLNWLKEFGEKMFADIVGEKKMPLTLARFDLNYLGILNHELGDDDVDKLLADIGQIFFDPKTGFRKTDVPLRVYGDTFMALMPQTEPETAYRAIFRILKSVESLAAKYVLTPSFSVGVAGLPCDGCSFTSLAEMEAATIKALSHAKHNSRKGEIPVIVFDKNMQLIGYQKFSSRIS